MLKLLRPERSEAIPLTDVAVVHDDAGAPVVELTGRAAELAGAIGCDTIAVSLSHERGLAIATAVALTER
ncbi:hypothetical protein P9139_13060 [Curtobacterium flaccumfaciens]|nr:hypothetical protein P9139_13060 [Curtobacterium flaccumfaciens]